MSTHRRWTDDEEQVVISKVKANPNNLQKAFREASFEIGRSVDCITQHWYTKQRTRPALKDRCGGCFMTYGGKSLNINRKNVCINTSDNTITISMDKLQKILDILLEQ